MLGERTSWGKGVCRSRGRWVCRMRRVLPSLTLRSCSGSGLEDGGVGEEKRDCEGGDCGAWKVVGGCIGGFVEEEMCRR